MHFHKDYHINISHTTSGKKIKYKFKRNFIVKFGENSITINNFVTLKHFSKISKCRKIVKSFERTKLRKCN